MNRMLELINQKNHYLEQFYALNEKEIESFKVGVFENLDYFYQTRDGILKNISYIEEQIQSCLSILEDEKNTSKVANEEKYRQEILVALAAKDEYVKRILEQDLQILTCIEQAKSSIIRELQDIQRSRKAVGGYKSPTFEKILDEEV
jgi:hypothetical protein